MEFFKKTRALADYNPATGFPQNTQVTGVFSPSNLALAIFPDVDTSSFPVDAATALTVPAVQRGLQIILSIGSRLPLLATDAAGNPVDLPCLTTTTGAITPAKRQASIVQDLILHNHALLSVARDDAGFIVDFAHVPVHYWSLDGQGNILINGKKATSSEVVYVPSLMPLGFLEVARDSIRQYRNITQTINNRTAAPEPVVIVKETSDLKPTTEEIDDMILQLSDSLTNKRGGIVYQPHGLEIAGFGSTDSANSLMLEAREAIRKDLANFIGIPVGLLDGTNGDSSTYQNAVDERNELLELTLKTWLEPIADRLSQPDCTPPEIKVSIDYSSFRTEVSAKGNTETETETESPVIPND